MLCRSEIEPQQIDLIEQIQENHRIPSDHVGVLVLMHVDVPAPTTPEPHDDIHNYLSTSWWRFSLILGAVFVLLDVVCCFIAWYS